MKTSGPADFKSAPGFENQPRFVGVIEQNKISQTFFHYCIRLIDYSNYLFKCSESNFSMVYSKLTPNPSVTNNFILPLTISMVKPF